nr:hypothetical protein [Pseudomonas putida]
MLIQMTRQNLTECIGGAGRSPSSLLILLLNAW